MSRHRRRKKSEINKEHSERARDFRESVKYRIKDSFPHADVRLGPERKGTKRPDILVLLDDCKIPIETKTRRGGSFEMSGNWLSVLYSGTYGSKSNYGHQVRPQLRNYGVSTFVVGARVKPSSPVHEDTVLGRMILARFYDTEEALELAMEYLKGEEQP